jgi:hypothetical protein
MGLSIGQIPAALAGLRSSPEFGRVRLREGQAVSVPRDFNPDEAPSLGFGRRDQTLPRVGFGEGTLSAQGAALRTINRTVEEVRRAQPSLAELRARFQEKAAQIEAADLGRKRNEPGSAEDRNEFQRIERRIPEASAQARRFIGDVNAGAAQALGRTGGAAGRPQDSGPVVEIRGERIAFSDRDRPRIDVRV